MTVGVHASAPTVSRGVASTTPTRTTTSGATIILIGCVVADTWAAVNPIADNKGNTWTLVDSLTTTASGLELRVYKAVNITGGAGHTFTITPGSNGFPALLMQEVPDAPAAPIITTNKQADTATPYTSPSISPATNVTVIGGIYTDAPSGTETDTWGGSFASGDKVEELSDADTSLTGSMAAVVKAAGTYNSSVTVAGVSITDSGVFIISVETTGGGGGSFPPVPQSPLPFLQMATLLAR